jgi:hypothetical protein
MARRRIRRGRSRVSGGFVASAVATGVLLALLGHHHGTGGSTAVTTRFVVPGGSAYTPASWASALLSGGGWPQTACNLGAVQAWERAEGGNWANSAAYNPLNTTQYEPGSSVMNAAGVRVYTSWREGFAATLTTLGYPAYAGIRSALSAGDSAQAVADAVAGSPWGTGSFTATC